MRRKYEDDKGQNNIFVLLTIAKRLQTNIVSTLVSGGTQDPSVLVYANHQLHKEGNKERYTKAMGLINKPDHMTGGTMLK